MQPACSNTGPYDRQSNAVPLNQLLQLPKLPQIFAIYAITLLMYTLAGPDPDPSQLPHPNEYNSTLTSRSSESAAPTQRPHLYHILLLWLALILHTEYGSEVSLPRTKNVGILRVENCLARIFYLLYLENRQDRIKI